MLHVGILGATGMVGQRFVSLLENHPWFAVTVVAASPRSAGKPYHEAVADRWEMQSPIPSSLRNLTVLAVEEDREKIAEQVDLLFSALDLEKEKIKEIEEWFAGQGIPVVSNNSAHRWTPDVPMIMPEINADHLSLISVQQKNRGWKKGFIVVKPNCSLQSYLPPLFALRDLYPEEVMVTTFQAISGAGKTFKTWPEMIDNVIPFIGGEEEKSEKEPLKIWSVANGMQRNIFSRGSGDPPFDDSVRTLRAALRQAQGGSQRVAKKGDAQLHKNLKQIITALPCASSPASQASSLRYTSLASAKSSRKDVSLHASPCPKISAACIRVPVSNGHLAAVSVRFRKNPTREQILAAWKGFESPLAALNLPSSPNPFLKYFEEDNRPQTRLDRDLGHGMAISVGRLRQDPIFHWKFVCLSHNTIRGAAGGAILTAELLKVKGYLK